MIGTANKKSNKRPCKTFTSSNAYVVYGNRLNSATLGSLTVRQSDIFFSLLSYACGRGSEPVTMTLSELRNDARYMPNSNAILRSDVEGMEKKLSEARFLDEEGGTLGGFFSQVCLDFEAGTVTVAVAPEFTYLTSGLTEQFTKFRLSRYTAIRRTHEKTAFRLAMQWRSLGKTPPMSMEVLGQLFGRKRLESGALRRDVLAPAVRGLGESGAVKGIELVTVKAERLKGKPIRGYRFTFRKHYNGPKNPGGGAGGGQQGGRREPAPEAAAQDAVAEEMFAAEPSLSQREITALRKAAAKNGIGDEALLGAVKYTKLMSPRSFVAYATKMIKVAASGGAMPWKDGEGAAGGKSLPFARPAAGQPRIKKNSFNSFHQRQYDWEELERDLLMASLPAPSTV